MLSEEAVELHRVATEDSDPTGRVLKDIRGERHQQQKKWGVQDCSDFEWVSILVEEVGEACKEANDLNFTSIKDETALPRLREELIQVAAVACSWVEALDRRTLAQAESTDKNILESERNA